MRITQSQLRQIIKEELEAVLSEKAEETVSAEISAQTKKGKPRKQAVAIALSKKERGEVKEELGMPDPGVVGTTKKKKNAVCPPGTQWKEESGGFGNCVIRDESGK